MATSKPRVNVTLEPATYETLRRAAAAQGVSMSRVLADLVDSVSPMLARLADIGEALQRAPEEIRATLRQASDAAEPELMAQLGGAQHDFEQLLQLAEELGGGLREGEGGVDPRWSNTGVTR